MHTVRHEIEPELSLEPRRPMPPPPGNPERKKKRMLLALGVLLVTLLAVFVKDWDFWFPPANEPESAVDQAVRKSRKPTSPGPISSPTSASVAAGRERKATKTEGVAEPAAMSATTERAALPDLQVEVVAGNKRKTISAGNNAIRLDLTSPSSSGGTQVNAHDMVDNSPDHVQMSAQTSQSVNRPVAPDYPLLARQMKVQGAVILQALISRDGSIQELQIVSGPAILAAAAREAVRQWHFKPYYQNGQAIDTQARITVNFTISTN